MKDFNKLKNSINDKAKDAGDAINKAKDKGVKGGFQDIKDKFDKNKNKSRKKSN